MQAGMFPHKTTRDTMTKHPLTKIAAATAALLFGVLTPLAHAQEKDPTKEFVKKVNEATGLEFWGYARSGFYSGHKDQGRLRGNYSLGGDLQKYRLGNEGDHYIEFGIGKQDPANEVVRLPANPFAEHARCFDVRLFAH
jgi:hypothetical protein